MLAIMGPSGAGKTTLLSLLAAKANKAIKIEGKVTICSDIGSGKQPFVQ
jgi:ABC-type multidrug transport system ATPase subunit